jgi:hypothetical protein
MLPKPPRKNGYLGRREGSFAIKATSFHGREQAWAAAGESQSIDMPIKKWTSLFNIYP